MTKRILVVDDDPMIRHIVTSILSSEGYEVVAAEHGEAAAAMLDAEPRPVRLDLVVCDVMMPGLCGFDLLNRTKTDPDTKHIPFILLTGEKTAEDIMTGYSVGADYYITKPFTRQQLLYGLQLILDRAQ